MARGDNAMSKLIIINKTKLPDADAIQRVASFMATNGASYLDHITTFSDGTMVSAKRNLRSVTVHVWEEGKAN